MSWNTHVTGKDKAAVQNRVAEELDRQAAYNKGDISYVKDICYRIIEGYRVAPGYFIDFQAHGHSEGGVGNATFQIQAMPPGQFPDWDTNKEQQ